MRSALPPSITSGSAARSDEFLAGARILGVGSDGQEGDKQQADALETLASDLIKTVPDPLKVPATRDESIKNP